MALLCSLRSRLLIHLSLVDSPRDLLCQGIERDFGVHLRTISTVVPECTVRSPSATFKALQTHSATHHQDVSPILTDLDGGLAALDSEPSATTSSVPLDPVDAPLYCNAASSVVTISKMVSLLPSFFFDSFVQLLVFLLPVMEPCAPFCCCCR